MPCTRTEANMIAETFEEAMRGGWSNQEIDIRFTVFRTKEQKQMTHLITKRCLVTAGMRCNRASKARSVEKGTDWIECCTT